MSEVRMWDLNDPDLPEEFHLIRAVFTRPTFGQKAQPVRLTGIQQARLAAMRIRENMRNPKPKEEQLTLDMRRASK